MNDNPFSPSWYRVAGLRPRLRNHDRITRHVYREKVTYLLEDQVNGHVYRFTPEVYAFLGLMTGEHTVQEILDGLAMRKTPNFPTQDQVIEILSGLHTMDALICDIPPDTEELFLRNQKQNQPHYLTQLKRSVLFLRFPLYDPEKILQKYSHLFNVFFTRRVLWFLLGLFVLSLMVLFVSWHELTANLFDTLFTRNNLFIIWLVYPCIKTVHELAHAFAVKKWGGEVHEIGLMFLLFIPVPYVNATASSAFADKWQRIAVSSAGILAELFLASLALLLWSLVEPGLTRSVAYNIIMLGGFSTLLFNGNPLVRFDGYYVFSDLLEIPNLAQRSQSYLGYLTYTHLLRLKGMKSVPGSSTEKRWYLFYGLASFAYRLTIYGSIFFILSSKFSTIGAFFGLFAIGQLFLVPAITKLRRTFATTQNRQYRSRVLSATISFLIALLLLVAIVPFPYSSHFEGVLLPPDDAIVRMATDGIVISLPGEPNRLVNKGDILVECEDVQLAYNIELLQSQTREYQQKEKATFATDPFEARIVHERLKELMEGLKEKLAKRAQLTVRSPTEGTLIIPEFASLPGRFLRQGDLLAYVSQEDNKVRVIVSQADIDIITENTVRIELVFAPDLGTSYAGRLLTENPQATLFLPSKVLSTEGGGNILIDPDDSSGRQMLEEMFQLDIVIDAAIERPFIGSRVYIRFYHASEPLLFRWQRSIRQLFLTHFHA